MRGERWDDHGGLSAEGREEYWKGRGGEIWHPTELPYFFPLCVGDPSESLDRNLTLRQKSNRLLLCYHRYIPTS